MLGDFDKHGDAVVPGQALSPAAPDCAEHVGTCVRCHTEIKSKPRKKFQGEQRRQRKTLSIKVPQDDQEDGAGLFDEMVAQARELLDEPTKPVYYILMAALYVFVRDAPRNQ